MPVSTEMSNAAIAVPDDLKSRLRLHRQFASEVEHEKRDIILYLPPMYDTQSYRRFPVLYMQDGQNLFDPETSFIKGNYWRMGETSDQLINSGQIEPLIIVGLYNTGPKRIDEYTPVEDKRLGGGQAAEYGKMLVTELKPFIDQNYRTFSGRENTGIGGSSLGGLVSLYLGLDPRQIFGKVCAMSPSVWWRNRAIVKTVTRLKNKPDVKIWLDIGTNEGKRALPDAQALRDALRQEGWHIGQDLEYSEIQGAEHNELAWAQRVAPMLKFLYPPR